MTDTKITPTQAHMSFQKKKHEIMGISCGLDGTLFSGAEIGNKGMNPDSLHHPPIRSIIIAKEEQSKDPLL
jgi:hypothetical protein